MDAARQLEYCTIENTYNLPDGKRVVLIDGELYVIATLDKIYRNAVMASQNSIIIHFVGRDGDCKVYQVEFAVFECRRNIS